jgi:hypothetical protein
LASTRASWLVGVGLLGALGCGLFGPSGPPVAVEVLDEQPIPLFDPPSVAVRPGQVIVIVEEGFPDPGFVVRARARVEENAGQSLAPRLGIDVVTERRDGNFQAIEWYRRYRLTVSSVSSGTYALRLRWQNDFLVPEARSRVLVDTVVSVPP